NVAGKRRLVEAVVADPGFIHPSRAGNPNPVSSYDLSASVDDRSPFGLQLGKILHCSVVVPIEIHAADSVVLIDAEIHLAQRVVDANIVRKPLDNIDALRVVYREAGSVAGYRSSCRDRAARDQLAGRTDTRSGARDFG